MVIVDNGSIDDTQAVAKQFSTLINADVRVLIEPKPGSGRAKNCGIGNSTGELIVFTDDDCYPASDFLIQWEKVFQNKEIDFGGGRIELYDPEDLPITIQTLRKRKDIPPGSFIAPGFLNGANTAFRRKALDHIDGFDERMGAGAAFACEDVDAQMRASTAGFWGVYSPKPWVYHHHGRKSLADRDAIMDFYAVGRGAYYVKCLLNTEARRLHMREILRQMYHHRGRTFRLECSGMLRYAFAAMFGAH